VAGEAEAMEVLVLVFPVFAAIVTGYAFARLGLLAEGVGLALIQFVHRQPDRAAGR
jgi:hypothetical protein